MNYYATLQPEAAVKLKPLSDELVRRAKILGITETRAAAAQEDAVAAQEAIAELKAGAGDALVKGDATHEHFLTMLRKRQAKLDAARSAIAVYNAELLPNARRDREEARKALERAAGTFYREALPSCENRMSDLLNQIVEERDTFLAACAALAGLYGTSIGGPAPVVSHVRVGTVRRHLTKPPELTFTNQTAEQRAAALAALTGPPAPVAAPATPAATCRLPSRYTPIPMLADAGLHDATPSRYTADVAQDVQDAPGSTPTGAPDAPDAEESVSDAPQALRDAAETLAGGPPAGAEGQTRPELPTGGADAQEGPIGMDLEPDALEPDAVAPTEAGKENLKIVAEST